MAQRTNVHNIDVTVKLETCEAAEHAESLSYTYTNS